MKNSKIYLKLIATTVLLSAIGLFLFQCQSNLEDIENDLQTNSTQIQLNESRDKLAIQFAKTLIASLSKQETRDFLKEEVLKTFDDDYDILIQEAVTKMVTSQSNGKSPSLSFGELLGRNSKGQDENQQLIASLAEISPLLQIAIPELPKASPENWDTKEVIPLVIVLSSNFNNTTKTLIGYDTDGKEHKIDAINPPEGELFIIISENERLIIIDKNNPDPNIYLPCIMEAGILPYYSTDTKDYYLKVNLNYCSSGKRNISRKRNGADIQDYDEYLYDDGSGLGGGGGGGSGGGGGHDGGGGHNATCDRDRKHTEDQFNRLKFEHMSAFRRAESRWDGKPEIRCYITIGGPIPSASSTFSRFWTAKRRKFKNCKLFRGCHTIWYDLGGAEIINWDKSRIGDRMRFDWFEEDQSTTMQQNDFNMGSSLVEYCDKYGEVYRTGAIQFTIK